MDSKLNTINKHSGKYFSLSNYLKNVTYLKGTKRNHLIEKNLFNEWKELTNVDTEVDFSLEQVFEKINYKIALKEKQLHKRKISAMETVRYFLIKTIIK